MFFFFIMLVGVIDVEEVYHLSPTVQNVFFFLHHVHDDRLWGKNEKTIGVWWWK
jgi:hypothetical protein